MVTARRQTGRREQTANANLKMTREGENLAWRAATSANMKHSRCFRHRAATGGAKNNAKEEEAGPRWRRQAGACY